MLIIFENSLIKTLVAFFTYLQIFIFDISQATILAYVFVIGVRGTDVPCKGISLNPYANLVTLLLH